MVRGGTLVEAGTQGAHVNEPGHTAHSCGLHDRPGAGHMHPLVRLSAYLFDDADQVNERVRTLCQLPHGGCRLEISRNQVDAAIPKRARLVDVPHQRPHVVITAKQMFDDEPADEAGGSGYGYQHGDPKMRPALAARNRFLDRTVVQTYTVANVDRSLSL